MSLQSAIQLLLVGPVVLVWFMALRDVIRRTSGRKGRRVLYLVPLLVIPPLSVPFLLTRPVSVVTRSSARRDDPRVELLDRIEAVQS